MRVALILIASLLLALPAQAQFLAIQCDTSGGGGLFSEKSSAATIQGAGLRVYVAELRSPGRTR